MIAEPVITTNVLLTGFISDAEGRLVGDHGLAQYTPAGGATWSQELVTAPAGWLSCRAVATT